MAELSEQQVLEYVQKAMEDFKEGGRLRDKEGTRIARRTSQIVRWSFVGMVLLGIGLSILLVLLADSLFTATEKITGIHEATIEMSANLDRVSTTMTGMASDISSLTTTVGGIHDHMAGMRTSVGDIHGELVPLEDNVGTMTQHVGTMARDIRRMDQRLDGIARAMGGLTRDMHDMSEPMRLMPWP